MHAKVKGTAELLWVFSGRVSSIQNLRDEASGHEVNYVSEMNLGEQPRTQAMSAGWLEPESSTFEWEPVRKYTAAHFAAHQKLQDPWQLISRVSFNCSQNLKGDNFAQTKSYAMN